MKNQKLKIIFFGTPDYVLPILTLLHKKFVTGPGKSPIVAVITQSPKPTGRKQVLIYSPIDKWAYEHKVPIYYDFNKPLPEAELGVCAAFGKIIPKSTIDHLPLGILNIHPSLLPKYRGASPIQAAIANGDTQTGVTIIKMDEKVDHGPIIAQFKEEITSSDTTETLRARLFEKSAEVLIDLIPNYLKGKINLKPQNHAEATFTKIITKQDGFIELNAIHQSPVTSHNFIRAMFPWPCAWTRLPDGKRLKLLPNDLVQLEGKNPVTLKQFEAAYPDLIGAYPNALLS